MKKIGRILMGAAVAMVSYSASAELAPQWSKGTMLINANFGVIETGADFSLDYVLVDEWWKGHFTVGGEFDFSVPPYNESAFGFTPRATYGLNITPNFEVHASVGVGFGIRNYKNGDDKIVSDSFVMYNDFVGCRFFFTENVAAFAEMGYSYYFSGYRLGVSFKF